MKVKLLLSSLAISLASLSPAGAVNVGGGDASASVSLKVPGNASRE